MKVFCDSSTKESCVVIEGKEPSILPYIDAPVTNNVGEYRAVIRGIEFALYYLGLKEIEVLTDSEFVVNQVRGYDKFGHKWRKCLPHLLPLRERVRKLLQTKGVEISLGWLSREANLAGKVLG